MNYARQILTPLAFFAESGKDTEEILDFLGVHDDDPVEFQAACFGRRHDARVVSDALGRQLAHPGVRADHSQKLARVRGALGVEFLNDGGDQPVRRCGHGARALTASQ